MKTVKSVKTVKKTSTLDTVYLFGGTDGTDNMGDLWLLKGVLNVITVTTTVMSSEVDSIDYIGNNGNENGNDNDGNDNINNNSENDNKSNNNNDNLNDINFSPLNDECCKNRTDDSDKKLYDNNDNTRSKIDMTNNYSAHTGNKKIKKNKIKSKSEVRVEEKLIFFWEKSFAGIHVYLFSLAHFSSILSHFFCVLDFQLIFEMCEFISRSVLTVTDANCAVFCILYFRQIIRILYSVF